MQLQKHDLQRLRKIIPPHDVKSRECLDTDIDRIKKDAELMVSLLQGKIGIWTGGFALAHSQITKDDPLRFFVRNTGEIILNPVIKSHDYMPKPKQEGCLTFWAAGRMVTKARWAWVEVQWQDGVTGMVHQKKFNGKDAQIFQHEIDHFEAIYTQDKKEQPNITVK
jgi:peptide deformylase